MTKLTPEDVALLREKATPRPWVPSDNGRDVWSDDGFVICEWSEMDSDFIAAAHDMADLVAERAFEARSGRQAAQDRQRHQGA